jgi:hypothetical protein
MPVEFKRGFQGSERTSVEVSIYPQGGDPLVVNSTDVYLKGQRKSDEDLTLVQVSTNKVIPNAGTFSLIVKPGRNGSPRLFESIAEDDWIDIVFKRNNIPWHVMRGLVQRATRSRSRTSGQGTSTSYVITGYDFQKIFNGTPLWYDVGIDPAKVVAYKLGTDFIENPRDLVEAILFKLFAELPGGGRGAANWKTPQRLVGSSGNFIDDLDYITTDFTNHPNRFAALQGLANSSGNLWELAKRWSDPAFTELWCDLSYDGRQVSPYDGQLLPKNSKMAVFLRDKPFPLTMDTGDPNLDTAHPRQGRGSFWFSLPQFIVTSPQIANDEVGKSGDERVNSFHFSPQITQMILSNGPHELAVPLRSLESISRHGLRRYDIVSNFIAEESNVLTMSKYQRAILRDWFSANHFWLSGEMQLNVSRPDIRVGSRLLVQRDNAGNLEDEHFYIEGVGHQWKFREGGRTRLGITRGHTGEDSKVLDIIETMRTEFEEAT